jgi:microcystin-dependent protein
MAWSISDFIPSWGDSGEQPPDGFQYDGGDQVNEKHLDYLWSSVGSLEDETRSALTDIDSDSDGVVDEADAAQSASGAFDLDGDLLAIGGETIWDESATHIPTAQLQYDSVTVTSGDGLGGGGAISLGSSATVSVDVTDLSGTGTAADGNNNLELEESVVKDGGAKEVDAAELAGGQGTTDEVLTTDGSAASWGAPPTVESGIITIWSGAISNIPNGWVLCDGNNGTPDLQNRFVVGAGNNYAVGDSGGSASHTLTNSELSAHSHRTLNGGGSGSGDLLFNDESLNLYDFEEFSANTQGGVIENTGGDSAHENRPPYYALAYIQKV